jgi:predicted secreted protein
MFRILGILAAATLLPGAALAADKDQLEVIGFSEDGTVFAYWTFGVYDGSGFPHAELNVFSTLTGKKNDQESRSEKIEKEGAASEKAALVKLKAAEAKHLQALKLGKDPGVEMYKSGTAIKTSFTLAGVAMDLVLEVKKGQVDAEAGVPKDRIAVRLDAGGSRQTLLVGGGGFDYSLNSVRLSADQKSIAVMLKHSQQGFEGPDRRYDCAAGRLPAK